MKSSDSTLGEMHIYYDGDRPDMVLYDGATYRYVHSLQGDILGLQDSMGAMVVVYRYDPWGRPIWLSGSLSETLGALNPFRYRGYVYDAESGLYYLRSRYYNPNWGRFLSADSILGQVGGLLQHNLFAYCYNNPVAYRDNSGTKPEKGTVVAIGISGEVDIGYTIAAMRGICFDGNGNVAEFITTVGYTIHSDKEKGYAAGVGLLGASSSIFAMIVSADSVEDLCGYGSYMGGSANIPVVPSPSLGYDMVFLSKRLKDITNDTVPHGGQVSFGGSVGVTWVHEGDSYTYIRYIVKNGVVVPEDESIWISAPKS